LKEKENIMCHDAPRISTDTCGNARRCRYSVL
jgi:hypothetical protein